MRRVSTKNTRRINGVGVGRVGRKSDPRTVVTSSPRLRQSTQGRSSPPQRTNEASIAGVHLRSKQTRSCKAALLSEGDFQCRLKCQAKGIEIIPDYPEGEDWKLGEKEPNVEGDGCCVGGFSWNGGQDWLSKHHSGDSERWCAAKNAKDITYECTRCSPGS